MYNVFFPFHFMLFLSFRLGFFSIFRFVFNENETKTDNFVQIIENNVQFVLFHAVRRRFTVPATDCHGTS